MLTPFGTPDLGAKHWCEDCGVTWRNDPDCWACGEPGQLTTRTPAKWDTTAPAPAVEPTTRPWRRT